MPNPKLKGEICPECQGHGTTPRIFFHITHDEDCWRCKTTGLINSPNACTACKGRGEFVIDMGWGIPCETSCKRCKETGIEPGKE